MTNTLLDLSGKIDKVTVSALVRIHQILSSIGILKRESQRKQGHRIAMDILQGNRFAEKSYEEIIALFDSLLKGLADDQIR